MMKEGVSTVEECGTQDPTIRESLDRDSQSTDRTQSLPPPSRTMSMLSLVAAVGPFYRSLSVKSRSRGVSERMSSGFLLWWGLIWSLLALSSFPSRSVQAYPVITPLEEQQHRCFNFHVPLDDDAHLVAVILPPEEDMGEDSVNVEAWYVDQVFRLTKAKKHGHLPGQFLEEAPEAVAQHMSHFLQHHAREGTQSHVLLTVGTDPSAEHARMRHQLAMKYFTPTVMNHLRKADAHQQQADPEHTGSELFSICLINEDKEKGKQVILDVIMLSEEILDEEDEASRFAKEKHLTPLEESLQHSIDAAEQVLKEMKHMEKRERRMRKTSDSINARVRWFSYLSVSILLAVTYFQVTYLKRYFHKKKLL